MKSAVALMIRNPIFVNILLWIIIFSGIAAAVTMIREVMPEFSIDTISVVVPYPGAGPEEVEEGVSLKIEDAIEGLEGIKRTTTVSSESVGTALIEVQERADLEKVKDDVTNRVNAITTFPDDAERPIVTELTLRQQVLLVAVYGGVGERQLKRVADDVKEDLLRLPAISQVSVSGGRAYEISIEISEEKLRRYGLTFDQVSAAVRQASQNFPAGEIKDQREQITIRTLGRRYTGAEYAEVVLLARPDGTSIRLGQVADIRDGFEQTDVITRFNGHPALLVNVSKTSEEDSLAINKAVTTYVAAKNRQLPPSIRLQVWADNSRFINERLDLLIGNGRIGLIIVFLLLWVFLDFRLAIWVSLGIPISIAGALALMGATGQTLNMISLFALIMILGIIVDDAIVVGESIYHHRLLGKPPVQAAIDGTLEVAWPVFAAVTTTIVAFAPLMFVSGIMGKFIRVLPFAVIAALTISLLESLFMLPSHLRDLPDVRPRELAELRGPRRMMARVRNALSGSIEWVIQRVYVPFMRHDLNWRYVTLSVFIAVFLISLGLYQAGKVKFELFPEVDTDFIIATIEFPAGTPAATTELAVKQMERSLEKVLEPLKTLTGEKPLLAQFSSVGSTLGFGGSVAENQGQVIVELLPTERRGIHFERIIEMWEKDVGRIPGALSQTFEGPETGPGGKPIEVWMQGDDLDEIRGAANALKEKLASYAGVYQIEDDFRPGKRELRIRLKPQARNLGLTLTDVGRQVRQGFYGDESLRIQRDRDEVKVWIRYPLDERRSLADLDAIRIRTPGGDEVPLAVVADVRLEQGYSAIERAGGQRRITVSADVHEGTSNAREIMADLQADTFPQLRRQFPSLFISVEGANADTQESIASLKIGFPIALLGIFLIMATMFRSYVQPFIIMITIPYGLIGAIFGHLALGHNITMLSLFGLVAVSGIVVNDAIVLIEAANERLIAGMSLKDALVDAGARRFRAIMLTSLTTCFGLAPLIMERSMQAQFLIPMAISIAFGVAFSTVLTLVLIPCLLLILSDLRLLAHWFFKGHMPRRRDVEPAAQRPLYPEGPEPDQSETGSGI